MIRFKPETEEEKKNRKQHELDCALAIRRKKQKELEELEQQKVKDQK